MDKTRYAALSILGGLYILDGQRDKAIETAKNALTMNLSIEQVAILTGLSPEEIEKLSDSLN